MNEPRPSKWPDIPLPEYTDAMWLARAAVEVLGDRALAKKLLRRSLDESLKLRVMLEGGR